MTRIAPEPLVSSPPSPRWESDIALSVFLVLLALTTVMSAPLRAVGAGGVLTVLELLLLTAGMTAIAAERSLAVGAGIAALASGAAALAGDEHRPLLFSARIVFSALVAAALLRRVFRPGRITVHRILGAVSVYTLLAVLWGTAYQLVETLQPGAIRGGAGPASLDDAMWFSFITITTTGYGDILPVSDLARSLSALESVVGVLYPPVLISRLVSLAQGPSAAGEKDPRAPGCD
jgi:hypothetical protein